MSNLIEAAPEEPGNGTGGSNRPFVLIALGLASLLVLGLLLIFGYVAGSRFGLFGARALATPDASVFVSGPAGTATAVALAAIGVASGATLLPTASTSAAAAATPVAGTRVPGAGTGAAGPVATSAGATATPTRVVGGAVSTPAPVATGSSLALVAPTSRAGFTLAPVVAAATNAPRSAASGSIANATTTPSGPGSGSSLPSTGIELDILIMSFLMAVLVILARGFRIALHS